MFTHKIISSGQKCFAAAWWPTKDKSAGTLEKAYPLMVFESGQVNRVSADNLERLPTHNLILHK